MADTNNIAEAFLQLATQAPQPIQVAESNELSASLFSIGIEFASCVFPEVLILIKPPACWILSNDERSTTRSLTTGKALARKGSITMVSPSLNFLICNWHVVTSRSGP